MSRLGVNAQILSRCGSCWTGMGVAPVRIAAPLCYNIRQASTARPKETQGSKKAAKGASAAAPKPKKTSAKPVTEAIKVAKPAKKAQASKTPDAAPIPKEAKAATPAKQKTRVTKPATADSTTALPESAASHATTITQAATAATAAPPSAYSATSSHKDPRQAVPPTTDGGAKVNTDPSGPEYKRAARNWTATMIALPILIVTSYFLFERLVVGKNPSLEPFRSKPQPILSEEAKTGRA